jgi:hypothetical protein
VPFGVLIAVTVMRRGPSAFCMIVAHPARARHGDGRGEGEEPILRPGKAMAYHQTVREDARQVAGAGRAPSGRSGPVRQPIGAGCVGGMCVDF